MAPYQLNSVTWNLCILLTRVRFRKYSVLLKEPLSQKYSQQFYLQNPVYLGTNDLTGTIPSELGLMSKLNILNLANNNLAGTIPSQIGSLTALRELYLSESAYCITYSSMIYFKRNESNAFIDICAIIHVGNNNFTGEIPSEAGKLKILQTFHIGEF